MTQPRDAVAPGDADAPTTGGEGEGLKREFSLWAIFALAFAFISPIVALYGIFAFSFLSAGPAMWWGFFVVLAGQLLVAAVFAELASRWPFEGSIYQWSRRLIHETYGWFAGWAYMWTLMITMVAVAYGAAGFVPVVFGLDPFEPGTQLLVAMGFLIFGTLMNLASRAALKVFMLASIGAEVLGSIGIGTVLLFFHNEQPLSSVFESAGAGAGPGGYIWAGFFAAVGFIGWTYVGFETAASVAEETPEPRRDVPKAIILSLITVAAVVTYSSLALILAIPDYGAVISGEVVDPVADTISFQLGSGITKPLFVLFIVGFTASLLAIQTNCSRVMWAFARADVLPASGMLKKLSPGARLPVNTVLVHRGDRGDPADLDAVRGRLPDAHLDGHRRLLHLVRAAGRGGPDREDAGSLGAGGVEPRPLQHARGRGRVGVGGVRVLQHRLAARRGRALVSGLGRVRHDRDSRGARRGGLPLRAPEGPGCRRSPRGR